MMNRRGFLALAGGLLVGGPALAGPRLGRGREKGGKDESEPARRPALDSAILGAPTTTGATLSLLVQRQTDAFVVLVDAGGRRISTTPVGLVAGTPTEVSLEGLPPGSAGRYEVLARGTGDAPGPRIFAGSLQTARPAGTPFRFAVHADPHMHDQGFSDTLYAATLQRTLAGKPDFLIDLGDNFMTEKFAKSAAEARQLVQDLRGWYGSVGHSVPIHLMTGNHEAELGWMRDSELCETAHALRRQFFPCPRGEGFYSGSSDPDPGAGRPNIHTAWHWGDALFVLLDPFWFTRRKPRPGVSEEGWNWTLGKEQYDWLASTLRGSKARAKFVFCHHLVGGGDSARGGTEFARLFEWGGQSPDGSRGFQTRRPGWGKPIHDLLVETGVTIFFHGHDHFFAQQELDGVTYLLVPQPSHRNTRQHSAAEYGYKAGTFLPNSGHVQVDVSGQYVEVSYLGNTGEIEAGRAVLHSFRCKLQ